MSINDDINNPSHYTSHPSGVECKDIIKHMDWAQGSAIKYLWRMGKKGDDAIKDLLKAKKCIDFQIEKIKEEQLSI